MVSHKLYYELKPFIPRSIQLRVRRMVVQRKRKLCEHIWPIDGKAAKPPEGWTGWPDGKKFALVLMHDVDTEKGHEKCLELAKLDEKMGFQSSFNFVPERYHVSSEVRRILVKKGFEIGVHGLKHDGKLFSTRKTFEEQAIRINQYLEDWQSVGFVSPSMHRNLDWMHDLKIKYDTSTFDTDPFEPQPDGVCTIFPFWVPGTRNSKPGFGSSELVTRNSELLPAEASAQEGVTLSTLNTRHSTLDSGYVELPYTLPQDHTLFILMQEKSISVWKQKLDWVADRGGMALLITHPDYMNFDHGKSGLGEYTVSHYREFLEYVKEHYCDLYWNVLPREVASFLEKSQKKDPTIHEEGGSYHE